MKPFVNKLASLLTNQVKELGGQSRQRLGARPQWGFQRLEDRRLFDGDPLEFEARLQALRYSQIDDMTELAVAMGTIRGEPTHLYINFDGGSVDADKAGGNIQTISPFDAGSATRDQDIQEILFRVSEIFAPFNVKVTRFFGASGYNRSDAGHTTVFIGDSPTNMIDVTPDDGLINPINVPYAGTYSESTDYPSLAAGTMHGLNSNPFDTTFVDPVFLNEFGGLSRFNNRGISEAVAHEAAHTFGLAHVATGGDPEVMSYTARNMYFADTTFALTNLNNGGDGNAVATDLYSPVWHYSVPLPSPFGIPGDLGAGRKGRTIEGDAVIATQNSFSFLTTMLGARPSDDHASVVHRDAVDNRSFHDSPVMNVYGEPVDFGRFAYAGAIDRMGDYDVYDFYALSNRAMTFFVNPPDGSDLDTVIMVWDETAASPILFDNSQLTRLQDSVVSFQPESGRVYKVVVGASNSQSTGSYTLHVLAGMARSNFDPGQFTDAPADENDPVSGKLPADLAAWPEAARAVERLYQQVLHRAPDAAGWKYWAEQVATGNTSLGKIASGFFESQERLDPIIATYYREYLLREIDAAGLDHWRGMWQRDGGPDNVVAGIISSPEFYQSAGGTAAGWVNELYSRLLNRQADQSGLAFWTQSLDPHGMSRQDVVVGFVQSTENFRNLVEGWHEQYLGRQAQPDEIDLYVTQMVAGDSQRDIQISLIDSDEYRKLPIHIAAVPASDAADHFAVVDSIFSDFDSLA